VKKTIKVCDFWRAHVPTRKEGMVFVGALLAPDTGADLELTQSGGISAGKQMFLRDSKDPVTLCWPCFDRAYGRSRPSIRGEG